MSPIKNFRQLKKSLKDKLVQARNGDRGNILREAAKVQNPAIFSGCDTRTVIGRSIDQELERIYLPPTQLTRDSSIHKETKKFFARSDKHQTICSLVQATTKNSKRKFSLEEQAMMYHIVDKLASTYIGRDQKPLKMKLEGHKVIEHSLHALQLLVERYEIKFSTVIATLLHDWIEDAGMEIYKERTEAERGKGKQRKEKVRTEQEIIDKSIRELYNEFETKDKHMDRNLIIGIEASAMMTTRAYLNYPSYIRGMTHQKRLRRNDSPLGDLIKQRNISQNEIIETTILAKIADKETGMLTWDPFNSVDKLKTLGKAELVINIAREFTSNENTKQYHENIKLMTDQLLISTKKQLNKEAGRAQELLDLVYHKKQPYKQRSKRRFNKNIIGGLYTQIERGTVMRFIKNPDFRGSFYGTILLGSKPQNEFKNLPHMLKRKGETELNTRIRLIVEKSRAENDIIKCNIGEYLAIVKKKTEGTLNKIDVTYLKKNNLHEHLSGLQRKEKAQKIQNYLDTIYAFGVSTVHMVLDQDHFYNFEVIE